MSKPNPIPITNNVYYSLVSMIINIYLWYKNIFWIPTVVFYSQFFSQSEAGSAAIFFYYDKTWNGKKTHLLMPSAIENCLPFELPLAMFIISNGKKIPATKFVCHFKLYKRKKISSGKKNCLPRENMRGSLTGSKTGFMTWNFCCCCCNVTGGVRLLNLRLIHTQLNFYRIIRDFLKHLKWC